jgi:AcrR family transcriptional regulator
MDEPQTRLRILNAARDLFLQGGVEHLSMRKVASRSGVVASAIYRHYSSKEELLQHVVALGFQVFDRYLYAVETNGATMEGLQAGAQAYLNFALEQQEYYKLIFMSDTSEFFRNAPPELMQYSESTFQYLKNLVSQAMESGLLREQDSHIASLQLWSVLHGQISLFLIGCLRIEQPQFEQLFYMTIHDFIQGGPRSFPETSSPPMQRQ